MLTCVLASIERQLWGVLLRRWSYVHVCVLSDVMKFFMNPECLGQGVEILVAIFGTSKTATYRQWSSVCGHPQLEIGIMTHYHESGKRWWPKDGVVL
jgi:hypothetical protein